MNHLAFHPFQDCFVVITDNYKYEHKYRLSNICGLVCQLYNNRWLIFISLKDAEPMEYKYIKVNSLEEGNRIIEAINRKKLELGIE